MEAAANNNHEVTQHEVKPKPNDLLGPVKMRRWKLNDKGEKHKTEVTVW